MESDDLLLYLSGDGSAASEVPNVSDYEEFFAQRLTEAQNIIHISMARYASRGYENALAAAECFVNVTVFDSGYLSSGMGLFALCAAKMAFLEITREELLSPVATLDVVVNSHL